jgi:D-tyrosyl-tRNA(Tyr) deacylase
VIGLLQRVSQASVSVDGQIVGQIGTGLVVLVGVQRGDTERQARRLAERLLAYRVFEDDAGRMNRSVTDIGGELLLVPQFTLSADTSRGNRASFSRAGAPETARELFDFLTAEVSRLAGHVQTGEFGADMSVALTNEGPVTFWLQVNPD